MFAALLLPALLAQSSIQLSFAAQSTDPDVLSILRFQNIEMWDLDFAGQELKGHYEIRVKRFVKGKMTLNEVAFDSAELGDFGLPKENKLSFRVLSQAKDKRARLDFQFSRWSVQKSYPAIETRHNYVMKNFLGATTSMPVDPKKETYILAYLQPTVKKDGFASYCEVAQSGLDPEKLYQKYQLPCYFLVSIRFK